MKRKSIWRMKIMMIEDVFSWDPVKRYELQLLSTESYLKTLNTILPHWNTDHHTASSSFQNEEINGSSSSSSITGQTLTVYFSQLTLDPHCKYSPNIWQLVCHLLLFQLLRDFDLIVKY